MRDSLGSFGVPQDDTRHTLTVKRIKMTEEEKIEIIKRAFMTFKDKMSDIRRRQLSLFDKIDKISSREKADELRSKINNN